MNPLSLVETGPAPTAAPPGVQLQINSLLASQRRLWFRGQLLGLPSPTPATRRWWPRRAQPPPAAPLVAQLRTQLGGKVLESAVPVGPAGTLDATFEVELPSPRRGWRVARNHLEIAGQTIDACGVVAAPPEDAAGVAVVLLPRAETLLAGGAAVLERAFANNPVGPQLHELHNGPAGGHLICYLACVPPGNASAAGELALAVASLGWPNGTFILVPTDHAGADAAVAGALDRIRWLFAEALPVRLLNLDPACQAASPEGATVADRATLELVPVGRRDVGGKDEYARPSRGGLLTRFPIVFCHGMLACSLLRMKIGAQCNYFAVMRDFLEGRGFRVLFPSVRPTGSVAARAAQLREHIDRWTGEPINIVAHSMGGLDARHLITHLGMADRVKSLTTIGTPHRGSYLADWFQANYRRRVPLLLALEAMGMDVDGFRDCQPAVCAAFNARTPDAPGVRYFSYGGAVPQAKVSPMLRRAWSLLQATEGENDGLVSVASARWGEYLGTIYADHFAQTPDGLFVHPSESFDSLGFFTRLVEDLARRGF